MFDNKMLGRILGHEMEKARGRRRKLHRENFRNLKLEVRNKKWRKYERGNNIQRLYTKTVQLIKLGTFPYKAKCKLDMSGK